MMKVSDFFARWAAFFRSSDEHFDALETQEAVRPYRMVIKASAIVFLTFLLWASWAEIDQITRGSGTVIASSKTQIIQSEEVGSIKSLLVKEGDSVKRGDILIKLDPIEARSSLREAKAKRAALEAVLSRLQAEVLETPLAFSPLAKEFPNFIANQKSLYKKRQRALNEELDGLKHMARLAKEELELNKPLVAGGHVSETDIIKLERQLADVESKITNKRNSYFSEAQAELSKTQEELATVVQTEVQRQRKLNMTQLVAPVDGIVKNVRITTEGGVVRPGEEIMQIVPANDALIIEAKVSPVDIAFLEIDQPVTVKVDAFDYTIFGDLNGRLIYISADTLIDENSEDKQPYYRVQVKTESNRFKNALAKHLDILPGMTSTVEVITGSNTVLQYITKPLVKTLSESLGER